MICASIISRRTAESQSAGGGQTHNETESSHSTASLIFILFMQGVGYLRSKFLPGCAGLGSRMVYANSKLNFEFASLTGEGGCSFKGGKREKTVELFGIFFQTFCGWCRSALKKSTLQME